MSRRRSLLFGSKKLPNGWYLANQCPMNNAYLALWYQEKLYAIELDGYFDAGDDELVAAKCGIVVASDTSGTERRFIVSDADFVNSLAWTVSAGSGLVSGVVSSSGSSSVAAADFEGQANTWNIYMQKGGYAVAAGHCLNTLFPNGSPAMLMGGGQGYILRELRTHISSITSEFLLGAISVAWTSTQSNATTAHYLMSSSGMLQALSKTTLQKVRRVMEIPEDNGYFKPTDISYSGEYTWTVKDGYRSSPLSKDRLETTERIHIKNNSIYQRVRVSAYLEGESDAYTKMYIGLLNEDWGSTGRWSAMIYPYDTSFEKPHVVEFDVPAYGENYIDIRLFAFQAGKQAFYKIEIIDELPKLAEYTYNAEAIPAVRDTSNGFKALYCFTAGSYVGNVTINTLKKMVVRMYYYPVGGATTAYAYFSEVGASSITTTLNKLAVQSVIIPPKLPSYIDYFLNEGENKILIMLRSTAGNNYYFYTKFEEIKFDGDVFLDYAGNWVRDVYGYYQSPMIGSTSASTGNTKMRVKIYTLKDNVTLKVKYYSSSRAGNYMYVGKLNVGVGTSSSTYSARIAGTDYDPYSAPELEINVPTAGAHYLEFMYNKTYSAAAGDDAGFFKIEIIE